jgi:hypothetical protein
MACREPDGDDVSGSATKGDECMNQHPLRTPLEHVKSELDRVPPPVATDPLLEELRYATTVLLAQGTASPTVAPYTSLREQLSTARDRFEVKHPTLAATVVQVIDTLNRMGI